jgi:hypothetical protein
MTKTRPSWQGRCVDYFDHSGFPIRASWLCDAKFAPWDVDFVPCWNDGMTGYQALFRGTLCVSRDKGELDNL